MNKPTKKEYEAKKREIQDHDAPVYPCRKCGGAVRDGYCCERCGDNNPSEPLED